MTMTRKEFIGTLIGGAILAACGGEDTKMDSGGTMRNCATNGTNVQISSNHGHVMTVTASDVNGGADKTYDIMGTADHTHMVTIAAADFARLQSNANASVTVNSTSGGGHTHTITVLCA
jgi:hypothetical protein